MVEETADSGAEESSSEDIDMGAAMDDITSSVFPEAVPDEPVEAEPEPEPEPEKEEAEVRAAPQSWKKEMHEFWNGLDPAVQSYVEQRESQMADGLEKDRGDANLGRVMRDVMAPFSEMLKTQNIDESVMVRNLMNAHYRLSTADDAGKADLMNQLAQSYGISMTGEQSGKMNPELKAMQDRLQGLESHITSSHEKSLQESRTRVESDVEAFAADPEHEFFDEVAEQIVPLINAGYELEDAYQNALWLNPVTRQKEIDRQGKEAAEKALNQEKQEAEKAKKAKSANVKGRDTSRTPTEPTGTMEDTMRETYREINRSH